MSSYIQVHSLLVDKARCLDSYVLDVSDELLDEFELLGLLVKKFLANGLLVLHDDAGACGVRSTLDSVHHLQPL